MELGRHPDTSKGNEKANLRADRRRREAQDTSACFGELWASSGSTRWPLTCLRRKTRPKAAAIAYTGTR